MIATGAELALLKSLREMHGPSQPIAFHTNRSSHPLARKLSAMLADVQYKPGFVLTLVDDAPFEYGAFYFRLSMPIMRLESGTLDYLYTIFRGTPELLDDGDYFMRLMYEAIRTIETHEIDEHFIFRGKKPFDPHATNVKG